MKHGARCPAATAPDSLVGSGTAAAADARKAGSGAAQALRQPAPGEGAPLPARGRTEEARCAAAGNGQLLSLIHI
eukprot:2295763-Prymnesium_polylepis.2